MSKDTTINLIVFFAWQDDLPSSTNKDLIRHDYLPKYGFTPEKFTKIKIFACNSAVGGNSSVAAGVWSVTHLPTTGAIPKVWGIGSDFLSIPYGALESGVIDYGTPGLWVTYGR